MKRATHNSPSLLTQTVVLVCYLTAVAVSTQSRGEMRASQSPRPTTLVTTPVAALSEQALYEIGAACRPSRFNYPQSAQPYDIMLQKIIEQPSVLRATLVAGTSVLIALHYGDAVTNPAFKSDLSSLIDSEKCVGERIGGSVILFDCSTSAGVAFALGLSKVGADTDSLFAIYNNKQSRYQGEWVGSLASHHIKGRQFFLDQSTQVLAQWSGAIITNQQNWGVQCFDVGIQW
jgi:hypothetical protein